MSTLISLENEQKMKELLADENAEVIIKSMINKYCNTSIDNAVSILNYIKDIVNVILKCTDMKNNELSQAAYMLMFQNEMDKKEIHSYFATMVPVCKTLFPDGYPTYGNLAQKKYFEQFIELCKNEKAFNWNEKSDLAWAKQFDYMEYLDMIFENYVD